MFYFSATEWRSPQDSPGVLPDGIVRREHGHAMDYRLRHDHSIERVPMKTWKPRSVESGFFIHWQGFSAVSISRQAGGGMLVRAMIRFPYHLLLTTFAAAVLTAQTTAPRRAPDVPYVPTTPEAVAAMLKLAGVTPSDVVYDLGCGDGRIVVAAGKLGSRGVGIDIDPVRVKEARANVEKAGVGKLVRIEEADIFLADIRQASVVILFLLPELNVKLLPKLLGELKPGTRIVSNSFDMGDWPAEKEVMVGDPNKPGSPFSHQLFMWTVPPDGKLK